MTQDLLRSYALSRVNLEDLRKQVPDVGVAQVTRYLSVLAILDFSVQVGFELAEEGHFATVDYVEDHACRPHVCCEA